MFAYEIHYGAIRCVLIARASSAFCSESEDHQVEDFLKRSHPRQLRGAWKSGWSLGFHSQFYGDAWTRSQVGELAYRLKYQSDSSVLPALVKQALDLFELHPELIAVDAVVPVPSTSNRNFDPVHSFCTALAEAVHKPALPALSKTRTTLPQKEMKTFAQKRVNVAHAFCLKMDLNGKRLLVVDDLFDSGETLNEITRLLIKSGVTIINVLTLTSTIHSDA